MERWENGKLIKDHIDDMERLKNDKSTGWQVGKTASGPNFKLIKTAS
jgi:hypothetical protein